MANKCRYTYHTWILWDLLIEVGVSIDQGETFLRNENPNIRKIESESTWKSAELPSRKLLQGWFITETLGFSIYPGPGLLEEMTHVTKITSSQHVEVQFCFCPVHSISMLIANLWWM